MTVYYGIDTEFLSTGTADQNDVHCIQISDGHNQDFFFTHQKELQQWFWTHKPDILYTWTTRPEFGSLKAWEFIGANPYNTELERVQRFNIEWKGTRNGTHQTLVYDIQPYFKTMIYKGHGLGSLAAIGQFLTDFYHEPLNKLQHPLGNEFGARAPATPEEWQAMRTYSIQDARICARAAEWFTEHIIQKYIGHVPIKRLYSWGTLARYYFNFPALWAVKYYGRKKKVYINAQQIEIHRATFAGRNEAFIVGHTPNLYYNDINSLYPCATCWTNALEIDPQLTTLTRKELHQIHNPEDWESVTGAPFGWLCGDFTSKNDQWGLPTRSETLGRNFYVTGTIPNALYHTYDLLASHAKIETLYYGYKPEFYDNPEQQRYIDLTFKKLEDKFATTPEKYSVKGLLNSATGKLGQSVPLAATSNFAAYNTIVAAAHYIDSQILDLLTEPPRYIDTDSFFISYPINKRLLTLKNEKHRLTIPITIEERAKTDNTGCLIFRSKHYYCNADTYTVHAWKWFITDWLKIIKEMPEEANVQRQIVRTFKTRDKQAKTLQIGRWKTLQEKFDHKKLAELFRADDKRVRQNYDSYRLCREHKTAQSRAWTFKELQQHIATDRTHKFYDLETAPLTAPIVPETYVQQWIKTHPEQQIRVSQHLRH